MVKLESPTPRVTGTCDLMLISCAVAAVMETGAAMLNGLPSSRHGKEEQRMKERRRSGRGLESDGEWYHERECEATQNCIDLREAVHIHEPIHSRASDL